MRKLIPRRYDLAAHSRSLTNGHLFFTPLRCLLIAQEIIDVQVENSDHPLIFDDEFDMSNIDHNRKIVCGWLRT